MLTLSLFGPIASATICLFLGRYIGVYSARLMLLLYMTSSISAIVLCYYVIINHSVVTLSLLNLSTVLGTSIELGTSNLDSVLLAIIVLVSTTVNTYSIYYMSTDAYYIRFIGLMSAFASFMCLLVVSNNLITLFICWELIGIFSYLLISYWSDRYIAIIASMKAIAMNKLGDYTYTIGLLILIVQIDSTQLHIINSIYSYDSNIYSNLAIFLLFLFVIAASAKSAQILMHN